MCSASLVAAPLCTGLASASLKTGASDSQQSAAEGDADPELSLWFYWRSFSPRVQASTARLCIRINRCYQHQQQIIFLGFVISGEQQVAASQFTLRMEREGSRGYIGISKQFSEGKRSSELELDKYIVKEAIICAPILLLVRYTANQRWGYGGFTPEGDLCFTLKWKKSPKQRACAYACKYLGRSHMKSSSLHQDLGICCSRRGQPTLCLLFPEHFSAAEIPVPKAEWWHYCTQESFHCFSSRPGEHISL